ncbi:MULTISPECIES: hypothetical protein [unclassified Beijerinckia]|uniref:hypothetical protein n=1 Tax=unclassified Beijerinckia TaxID=2638183 RepID=UPI000B80D3B3|nr:MULTISPECIES: hypothetical protein [unclassified Beijerinckia]
MHCLEKILQDQTFATSDRLSAFLRYIVTETLADRGSRLKGYNVALSVFSRGEKFDPQTNSVVRVEATRLRKQLATYYAGPGTDDPIEIRVNRGSYVPEFIERTNAPAGAPIAEDAPETRKSVASNSKVPWFLAGATVAALFLAMAGLAYWVAQPSFSDGPSTAFSPVWASPPSIAVTRLELPPESDISPFQAGALAREIAAGLGRFETIRVREVDPDATTAPGTEYVLAGGVGRAGDRHTISYRLVRASDNQIIWSKAYDQLPSDLTADHRIKIVGDIASTLGRIHGVIFADRYRQTPDLGPASIGFECMIYGSRYFNAPTRTSFDAAQACLQRTVAAEPKSSLGHSMLAILLVDGYVKGYWNDGDEPLSRAANAANEAVELAPQSARAHLALFLTRFHERRFTDAFVSARRALALNPFSTEIKARLGSAYALRGEHEISQNLLDEVLASTENSATWLQFYLFLNAYMTDNDELAARYTARTQTVRTPLGLIARIIMANYNQDARLVAKWQTHLTQQFPRFARDIPGALSRLEMTAPIRKRILTDLEAADALAKTVQISLP